MGTPDSAPGNEHANALKAAAKAVKEKRTKPFTGLNDSYGLKPARRERKPRKKKK